MSTANEWQPIETAPRDGSEIIAYDPTGKPYIWIVSYHHSRWIEATGEQYETVRPTHWMPVPPPPKASEAQK